MTAYDRWKEGGPVDALTIAETDDVRCVTCGGDFNQKSREPDEVTPFVPSHSDMCDARCPRCGAVDPDDDCARGRCDDPRIP